MADSHQSCVSSSRRRRMMGAMAQRAALLVRRVLRVKVSYGFKQLEETLDLRFIFGEQERVTVRRGAFPFRRRRRFAPELAVGLAFDHRLAREALERPQKALAGFPIPGIKNKHLALVREREPDNQRRRKDLIDAADFAPGYSNLVDAEKTFLNVDGWQSGETKTEKAAHKEKRGREPCEPEPGRKRRGDTCQHERRQTSPQELARCRIARHGHCHNFSLPPTLDAVNSGLGRGCTVREDRVRQRQRNPFGVWA